VAGYLGQFDAEWRPLNPGPDDEAESEGPARSVSPDCPVLVIYTSGATGAAAVIPKQLRQLVAEVVTLEREFGLLLGRAGIAATVSPQHIYSLVFQCGFA